jgi:hypothetical protein
MARECSNGPERPGLYINILGFFGSSESSLQDMITVDGTSIWAGAGVHLTSNATRVAAMKLMADLASGGNADEPAGKRARLESVIPTPAATSAQKTKAQTAVPPPPKPVLPLLCQAASQEDNSEADKVSLVTEEERRA